MYRTPMIGCLTAVLLAHVPALAGQGWIEPVRPGPGWGIQKLRSAVSVTLSGRVANVIVEEWFQNRGAGLGEGDYH